MAAKSRNNATNEYNIMPVSAAPNMTLNAPNTAATGSYEADLAEAIRLSMLEGVDDDINSPANYNKRLDEYIRFHQAIDEAKIAIWNAWKLQLGVIIDLTHVYTFTFGGGQRGIVNEETKQIMQLFHVHENAYEAIVVGDVVFRALECCASAFDDGIMVVDSNTCLYNCVYVWLLANKLLTVSLREFIQRVNKRGNIDRKCGDFGDEFVMKAMCDAYGITICTLWKSADTQRISFITHDGCKQVKTTSICYLVNEYGVLHFKLLVPDP